MKGRVTLYDYNGAVLRQFNYSSRPDRNKQMEALKFLYGKNIKDCYYEILPDISTIKIDEDGFNSHSPEKRKRISGKYLSGHPKVVKPINISYPALK